MEKNSSIEQVFETTEKEIINSKQNSVLKGIILLVIGFLIMFINSKLTITKGVSIIEPFLIMVGIVFIIWGALITFIRKTYYVDGETGHKYHFSEVFFDNKDHDKLVRIVESENLQDIVNVKRSTQDGVKLRVASTHDKSVCYVQVLTYIPYEYALTTKAIKLSGANINHVLNGLGLK